MGNIFGNILHDLEEWVPNRVEYWFNSLHTHGTVPILVATDSVDHFYYFVKPKAMAVTYIYVQGKTLKQVFTVDYILRKRHGNNNDLFCKISRPAKLSNAL